MPPKKIIKTETKVEAKSETKAAPKERNAKQWTNLQHAKAKPMWASGRDMTESEYYVRKGDEFKLEVLSYPPCLLKIIDEVIVNATDHHSHYPDSVTEIKINVSEDGLISVYNNGPGIPIKKVDNIQGKEMYMPQLVASEFLAGDNLDDDGDNIKGGTNGVGLKIAVGFSDYLTLETIDNGTKYTQKFCSAEDDTHIIADDPELKPTKSKPYTKVSFLPSYATVYKINIAAFMKTLLKLVETRCWYTAAYTKAKVWFNDKVIPYKSFEAFCQAFTDSTVYKTVVEHPKYPWDLCVAVSDGKFKHFSIVNGICIYNGGTHINHLCNEIVEGLKDKIEKELKKNGGIAFNKNYIVNNLHIFMKGPIPSPTFPGQSKENISDKAAKFKDYHLGEKAMSKIWDMIEQEVMSLFLKKQLGDPTTSRTTKTRLDVPKYVEAHYCRDAKKRQFCGLIVTEGDSATATADRGLLSKASDSFNYDYYGTYGIQGVMVNALKESNVSKYAKDDNITPKKVGVKVKKAVDDTELPPKRIPGQKIKNNERIVSLKTILGLDYNKTYNLTEIGDKEFKTLRYGFVAGLTDQDLDGFNIFGLLSTYFMTFWPSLLKRGFLRRIGTPVMRAFPTSKKESVLEFYKEKDFKEWSESIGDAIKKYKVQYYKGLGSHRSAFGEVKQLFIDIDDKIATYELDKDGFKQLENYYGKETDARKAVLSVGVQREAVDSLTIPISQQFEIDTKLYQRDNILRKLLNSVDGFVASRRKVFYAARKNGREIAKVAGLASVTQKEANYHHGEASLEQTIIRMAQAYPMARNLPLLQPHGEFGTRKKGYKDAAAPRYIFTTLNHRLADKLFRAEDDYLLDYEVDDGVRYEPKYYVPIIPYVLCESEEIPATGWKICTQARDIGAIFKNVRARIAGKIAKCGELPAWNKDFKGKVLVHKGKPYSVGDYEYTPETRELRITELPIGIYSDTWLNGAEKKKKDDKKKREEKEEKGVKKKAYVEDYKDETTEEGVHVVLTLKEGGYEAITAEDSTFGNETFDPIIDYFNLKKVINTNINLVNEKGEVVEYASYEKVFDDWYVFRKRLYEVRIERETLLTDLRIKMLKNQQRFSKLHDGYGITNKISIEKAEEIVAKEKYDKFNHTILESPKFTSISELVKLITVTDASYDYLLNMNYKDLTTASYDRREKKIKELDEKLKYLLEDNGASDNGAFKGSKLWLRELDELEEAINQGIKTQWFYGENNVKYSERAKKKAAKK